MCVHVVQVGLTTMSVMGGVCIYKGEFGLGIDEHKSKM